MRQKVLYGVGFVFALLLLFAIFLLPLAALEYFGASEVEARILSNSLAAASTFGLVMVTFITVWQNRQIIRKQEKEMGRDRQKDFVDDIILPTKRIVERNRRLLSKGTIVEWTGEVVKKGNLDEGHPRSLLLVCERTDVDSSELQSFQSEYSEMYEFMSAHDEKLREIEDRSEDLHGSLLGTLNETGIIIGNPDGFDRSAYEDAIDLILSDIIYVPGAGYGDIMSDDWAMQGESVRNIVEERHGEDIYEFQELKSEYRKMCDSISDNLESKREEISDYYRV